MHDPLPRPRAPDGRHDVGDRHRLIDRNNEGGTDDMTILN
jgi:hypothetical protein